MLLSSFLDLWIVHCIILKKRDVSVECVIFKVHLSAYETLHFACFVNATRQILFGVIPI